MGDLFITKNMNNPNAITVTETYNWYTLTMDYSLVTYYRDRYASA